MRRETVAANRLSTAAVLNALHCDCPHVKPDAGKDSVDQVGVTFIGEYIP
jgi:hypothetical protein